MPMIGSVAPACDDQEADHASKERLRQRLESLSRELKRDGKALPGNPALVADAGDDDEAVVAALQLGTIAEWVRYAPASDLARVPFRTLLAAAARNCGVRDPGATATLRDLQAQVQRIYEPTAGSVAGPAAALDALVSTLSLPWTTSLRLLFAEESLLKPIVAGLAKTHLVDEATFAKVRVLAIGLMEGENGTPSFLTRLQALVEISPLSRPDIAKAAGTNVQLLRRLLGGAEPRLDMEGIIRRLETALGAKPDELWSLVWRSRLRIATDDDFYTPEIRRVFKILGVDSDFLPSNWVTLPDREKAEAIDWIMNNVVSSIPARLLSRQGYDELDKLSPRMAKEWAAVRKFKTVAIPDEDDHPREITTSSGAGRHVKSGGRWRSKSAEAYEKYVSRTLTACNSLLPPASRTWCLDSGLGFLINPRAVRRAGKKIARQRYVRMKRAGAFKLLKYKAPEDRLIYGMADVARLEVLLGLFNAGTGYLYHHPPTCVAIPDLVDQAWVDRANADWKGVVREATAKIKSLIKDIERNVRQIRDPWLPILPLLERDDPLSPVFRALDRMERSRPSFYGTPMIAARHDRDHFLVTLLCHGRLRRAMFGDLTWRPDNSGHLRWDPRGHWKLVIPTDLFKNWGSTALPPGDDDVVIELDPTDEALYRSVANWLGVVDPSTGSVDQIGSSRRLLYGDDCGDAVFPGRNGGGMSVFTTHSIVLHFSARYLAERPWDPDGIVGVRPFGAHSIRDLVATHVIKATGSLEEAARALFDSPSTLAKHYARFTSEEKSKRTNRIIRESINREVCV